MPRIKRQMVLILSLILITSLFSIVFIKIEPIRADSFDGHYNGYGDSIMSPGFTTPAETSFVKYMQQRKDPGNTSENNEDGHSMTSVWGLANYATHFDDMGNWMIEQFGINDCKTINWISAVDIAQNKLAMYNMSAENDSETHYLPCVHTLADPAGESGLRPWSNQCDSINATENHFVQYSVRFVPLYDCLDSDPYNGRRDSWDGTHYYDGYVHPNQYAHEYIMANFLWFFINGDDYTETYHTGNDTITVQANYNETIYIYPRSGWDIDNIVLTCETNSTIMTFNEGVDVNGVTTIQFDILNGSYYTLQGKTVQWKYINNDVNNSNTTLKTRSFDFIKVNNSLYYNIEISNISSFTSIYINITDINETNYGVNYYEYTTGEGTYVHYNYTSDVDWGYKYYRVRAYRYVD